MPGQHAFDESGVVNVIARFDRRAGPHRLVSSQSVTVAPICG